VERMPDARTNPMVNAGAAQTGKRDTTDSTG
jgi:hypothetical protein